MQSWLYTGQPLPISAVNDVWPSWLYFANFGVDPNGVIHLHQWEGLLRIAPGDTVERDTRGVYSVRRGPDPATASAGQTCG